MTADTSNSEKKAALPYSKKNEARFWRTGVVNADYIPEDLWTPAFKIEKGSKFAAFGSCFAQYLSREMRKYSEFSFVDEEPPPSWMTEQEKLDLGWLGFSARTGNIYTPNFFKQLLTEAFLEAPIFRPIQGVDGRWRDGLRPLLKNSAGYENKQDIYLSRKDHLMALQDVFKTLDCLIFTLGLNESWLDAEDGTTEFPLHPAYRDSLGGSQTFEVKLEVANSENVYQSLRETQNLISEFRGGRPWKWILSVSPVPMIATAQEKHILLANTESKSVLISAAVRLAREYEFVEYFPAFEIVTNPVNRGSFFSENLRTPSPRGYTRVVTYFVQQLLRHEADNKASYSVEPTSSFEQYCDEEIYDAYRSN